MVTKEKIIDKAEKDISGFKPMTIGNICDICNNPLNVDDKIYLFGDYFEKRISWTYATHQECDIGLSEDKTNFVFECEIMRSIDEEKIVLGNPELVDINIS